MNSRVVKLSPFSGKDFESFSSFLTKFNNFCLLNGITDENKPDVIIFYLNGSAETYYNNLPENIKTDYSALK